jgi:hypothetical protein
MSQISEEIIEDQTPHSYFVDETGDGVIFDSKGRMLIGTGQVQDYFTLGMVECSTLQQLTIELNDLRELLLADPYFKGVPSLQPSAKKTALFFHAKDDLPEVRREVFRILQRHDFYFYAVVRTMSVVARGVVSRNLRDPTYRYRPSELYDAAVRRLFDKKLHTRPAFEVIFASRDKARTRSIREHLLKAQKYSRKADGSYPDAKIHVRAMPSHQHAGLQLTDYCLWALQRLFTKGEDRFLGLIWPKVGLIVDADDISEKPYGTYHTRKRSPMTAESIKNRKVED